MKKLLIVSDTHGNKKELEKLLPLIAENDYFIHLGDGAWDVRALSKEYPDKIYSCVGNCDLFIPYADEGTIDVEGVRIFYTHGHKYGVKDSLDALAYKAREKDCDIALYGHTHIPLISEIGGVTLINPGTLKHPLNAGGSYGYLVINGKKFTPVIVGESFH